MNNINIDYSYLIGQSVKGRLESRITDVTRDGIVTFYFRSGDELVTETADLAQIEVLTIGDR